MIDDVYTNCNKTEECTNVSQLLELYPYCSMNKQYVEGVQNRKKAYLMWRTKIYLSCFKNRGKTSREWISEHTCDTPKGIKWTCPFSKGDNFFIVSLQQEFIISRGTYTIRGDIIKYHLLPNSTPLKLCPLKYKLCKKKKSIETSFITF